MAEVTLDSITKRFGTETAVDGVDLTVEDGEVLGVVGPSGCGKTTTLRTVAGFETPTGGRVRFDGEDVTHVPPEDRDVGLVFQSYALFDNMTVRENVAFGPKMQGVDGETRRERADELLAMLDIADLADRTPTTLSGGQQQRVGLARALAVEPAILLLDEPMTGLDASLKDRLQREIGSLLEELGVTALYVTHDQEEAMVMCDRIAVMHDGRIEQIGTPREIYERPADPFVAEFVGTANLLEAAVDGDRLDLGFTEVSMSDPPERDEVRAVVRPDEIGVGDGPIEATVTEYAYVGQRARATVSCPDGQTLTVDLSGDRRLAPGDSVPLSIDPASVHLLAGAAE